MISSIKNYSEYKDKNLNHLGAYAERFKVGGQVRRYLEVLL